MTITGWNVEESFRGGAWEIRSGYGPQYRMYAAQEVRQVWASAARCGYRLRLVAVTA